MEGIRVLIVDDLPQVREGLVSVLNLAARTARVKIEIVGEAQNGDEAVQQAQALRPEVILMDLEMPGMDGYEATRRIKYNHPTTRVIILSIHADPDAVQCAREAGADAFLVKGAGYQILLNAIFRRDAENHSFDIERGA